MGRVREATQPPLDIAVVQANFDLRDGRIIRRECHIAALNGEPATFVGPKGVLLVRATHNGCIRRLVASRVAWALACGEWPKGSVKTKNGLADDFRLENLVVIRRGVNPSAVGTSSLKRRAEVDSKLIEALASHPHSSVARLGELAGLTESGASARLGQLAAKGLAASPMCIPGRAWALTDQGRALAATGRPALDDLDQEVLAMLSLTGMGLTKLARRVEVCPMTIKRRTNLMVERGLLLSDPRRFFVITDEGRRALGANDAPRPAPWVRTEQISAAARDVLQRLTHPNDHRTAAQRSAHATMAAAKAVETQRLHKRERQRFAFGER